MVKFGGDQRELLLELLAHGSVQLFNDLDQRFLRLCQVVMLSLEKFITLRNLFEFLNGIYIDIAQLLDLRLQVLDLPLHIPQLRQIGIAQLSGTAQRQLIFLPHVVDVLLGGFLIGFLPAVQTETFLIQLGHVFGELFPFSQKSLMLLVQLVPLRHLALDLRLDLGKELPGIFNGLGQFPNLLFLLLDLSGRVSLADVYLF